MIGGDDLLIPVKPGAQPLDVCTHVIHAHWPSAVFEDASTGETGQRFEALASKSPTEIFVYRDSQVARDWCATGALPGFKNTMIHLLVSNEGVTIVADDLNEPPLPEIVGEIRESIMRSAQASESV